MAARSSHSHDQTDRGLSSDHTFGGIELPCSSESSIHRYSSNVWIIPPSRTWVLSRHDSRSYLDYPSHSLGYPLEPSGSSIQRPSRGVTGSVSSSSRWSGVEPSSEGYFGRAGENAQSAQQVAGQGRRPVLALKQCMSMITLVLTDVVANSLRMQ